MPIINPNSKTATVNGSGILFFKYFEKIILHIHADRTENDKNNMTIPVFDSPEFSLVEFVTSLIRLVGTI